MRKYELLKDLPGCSKGHLFGQNGTSSVFTMQTLAEMEDATSKSYTFTEDFVKLNSDWFLELGESAQFKVPLFKSEDGVDVFDNDITHWCFNSIGNWKYLYALPVNNAHQRLIEYTKIYKVFSSEKLAKEFVDNIN